MSDWMPCLLAVGYSLVFGVIGYWMGRFREQLHFIEVFKP
jgi:hypothetical protein